MNLTVFPEAKQKALVPDIDWLRYIFPPPLSAAALRKGGIPFLLLRFKEEQGCA